MSAEEVQLKDIELDLNLEMLENVGELEFYIEYLEDEVEKLTAQKKIIEFQLSLENLKLECGETELDKEKVLMQVKEDGSVLKYVGTKFQDDYDVVLEAVQNYEFALMYASEELQNDYEIVYQALKCNPNAIKFASDTLKKNDDFILLYVEYWVGENKFYKSMEEFKKYHELLIDI